MVHESHRRRGTSSSKHLRIGILWVIDSFWQKSHVLPMSASNELTSMTVSLPASQKAYVKAQATASGCSTPSEYIRRLIHADQLAREQAELERRIFEGLGTPSREMTPEDWQELRGTLRKKLVQRSKVR